MFELSPLSALVEKQQGGGTPPRNEPAFWHGNIPWASVKDFKDDQLELRATEEMITSLGLRSSTSNLVPAGIPMVCTRMAVGRCAVSFAPTAINQDVRALYPRKGVDPRYLTRLISSLQKKAESLSVGSTVKGIRSSDFLAIQAYAAPEGEQGAIARILDTLDTQIQKTEALIAKLKKVKEGLLHDLLTRGIDENGQLRPSPEQAPELYKESPLGLIPKQWKIDKLGSQYLVNVGYVGPVANYSVSADEGVPLLSTANINGGGFVGPVKTYVSHTFSNENKKSKVQPGDLIIARHGKSGQAAIIPSFINSAQCLNVVIVRKFEEQEPAIVFHFLSDETFRMRLMQSNSGSVQGVVSTKAIASFPLPCVPPLEQEKIIKMFGQQQKRISDETYYLHKLKESKLGLMDDLLTGRVRVTSLLEQAQEPATA